MNSGERTPMVEVLTTLDDLEACIAQGEQVLRSSVDAPHTLHGEMARENVVNVLHTLKVSRDALVTVVQAYAELN
jgi:hypothetical protein